MSTDTIAAAQESLKAAQANVDTARAILLLVMARTESTTLKVAGVEVTLQPGERYAGAVLNVDGSVKHHLVLLGARPPEDLGWQAAKDWAASVGGTLPDRQEQALLYANCKPHLAGKWHWSSEEHESNASYAWVCGFDYGGQHYSHKDSGYAAVAVRRFGP